MNPNPLSARNVLIVPVIHPPLLSVVFVYASSATTFAFLPTHQSLLPDRKGSVAAIQEIAHRRDRCIPRVEPLFVAGEGNCVALHESCWQQNQGEFASDRMLVNGVLHGYRPQPSCSSSSIRFIARVLSSCASRAMAASPARSTRGTRRSSAAMSSSSSRTASVVVTAIEG